jgi:hexosaminidase
MTAKFSCEIVGKGYACRLIPSTDLRGAVLCYSALVATRLLSGGVQIRSVAGYSEIALPDLMAGTAHDIRLECRNPDFAPKNRAWLPMGAYLRLADGTAVELPSSDQGVRPAAVRPAGQWDGLRLVPQPSRWTPASGELAVDLLSCDHEAFVAADALGTRTGLGRLLGPAGSRVTLRHDDGLPPEAYALQVAPDGVSVSAADRAGIFHAAVTLLVLRATHGGTLPCGVIEDAPRFGWRGQHMDCARHYVEPATLERLLDLMALLKLNRFHWHFSDDEAFRLEVETEPNLWKTTAFRGEGLPIPALFGGGIRAGGSYSRQFAADLIARGRALNIEILPEVELPAHAFALNAVLPGLRDPGDNGAEISIQGYEANVINPAMPATWDLVLPLLHEVADLFPFGMVHLGCDELPPDTWTGSPKVADLMRREGLETRDDVQGWMMARVAADLQARGIRPAAWEEAAKGANGGIGHQALLFSWTGQGPGIEAARQGYDIIMCPAQNAYLDMAHTTDPDDWGATWAAAIDLEDTIAWTVVPQGAEDVADRIKGVQGTFWGEFTTTDRQIEPMLAPRIMGIAQMGWGRDRVLSGADLRAIAQHYGKVFDRIGWSWHRGA